MVALLLNPIDVILAATQQPVGFPSMICEACKTIVVEARSKMPQMEPKLEQLCQSIGPPDELKECMKMLHHIEDVVQHQSPKEICGQLGFCGAPHGNFVDFMGQFVGGL